MKNDIKYSQNFLINNYLVQKLICDSSLDEHDIVYEIGPGKGIITKELSKSCLKVIAVEYDGKLYDALKHSLGMFDNVELVHDDFIKYKLPRSCKYKMFSNIPFNITADILAKVTSIDNAPEDSYFIIQEEAAKKYAGFPYNIEGLRSLMLKPYFQLSIIYRFKNTDFSPVPNVDIVLLRINKRKKFLLEPKYYDIYADFISYAFSQSGENLRKRLAKILTYKQFNRLSRDLKFDALISPGKLQFQQWMELFKYYATGVCEEKQQLVRGAAERLVFQQNKLEKLHRSRKVKQ